MTVVRACSTLIYICAVGDTVASVTGVAHTVVASVGVGARRVVAAAVRPSRAFVHISAVDAVTGVTGVACTRE